MKIINEIKDEFEGKSRYRQTYEHEFTALGAS